MEDRIVKSYENHPPRGNKPDLPSTPDTSNVKACGGCSFVTVGIKGKDVELLALVDTGACASLISTRVMQQLHLEAKMESLTLDLVGVGGQRLCTKGLIKELEITLGGNLSSAEVMKELYNVMGIKKLRTTAYHPAGNGQVESYNKHLVVILRKLVHKSPREWPSKLQPAVFALNSSINVSTKFSPARLWFGRDLRIPADLLLGTTSTVFYKSREHLAATQHRDLQEAWDLALSNSISAGVRNKHLFDRKKGFHVVYKENDRVLVLKPLPPTVTEFRKFKNGYTGPWKITRVLSDWTYLVNHERYPSKQQVVHFNSMRLIREDLRTTKDSTLQKAVNDSDSEDLSDTEEPLLELDPVPEDPSSTLEGRASPEVEETRDNSAQEGRVSDQAELTETGIAASDEPEGHAPRPVNTETSETRGDPEPPPRKRYEMRERTPVNYA